MSAKLSLHPAGRALGIAVLAALALAGCGRFGPLEPPPDASAQAKPKPDQPGSGTLNPQIRPGIPPIVAPNQPFFLDFLLK